MLAAVALSITDVKFAHLVGLKALPCPLLVLLGLLVQAWRKINATLKASLLCRYTRR